MIRFIKVHKNYKEGEVRALNDVNFVIKQGEFISLVGRSGAGKTTLLNLITLELKPDVGKVLIEGQDISKVDPSDSHYLRRKIGVVYQDIKLLPAMTSSENVAFAMEVGGVPNNIIERDVPRILDLVGLKNKINSFPHQLSGGEKQRVAIARALAHKPQLLLADEPTGNLDDENAAEIIDLLLKINGFGTTVLLATHDSGFVNKIKKRVITLEDGKIVKDQERGKYEL
ncbi:MAG: cell division ATP-binding protein FtsE [Candidatus Doudnabacteria bacterium CG10_big_fil_rev_8_21_14_0_10_41_10]|uniref:Cell division ATP-binding protein FtsE n=1 Tax=Candidatus Doudnabacteria bacterium CG10_big_fil_rev_8_21_14_0_10_41_10 TaxID=1974551 RepID=A0A2H0VDW5_9BACT|nr:MAG: cell division ATP-binding protein FtsE [Candidatus Doudnabacteria bacterium CG10_big_fil_rev_8_21_14_0_10_41_10]